MKPRWPHQVAAVTDLLAKRGEGQTKIVLTSPTGMGKSFVMHDLAAHFLNAGQGVALYTNRRLLIAQLTKGLTGAGFDYGVRAADHASDRGKLLQVSSIATEDARVFKAQRWTLHDAALVLIDEAHLNKAKVAQKIIDAHANQGAFIVGVTATPLNLGDIYDDIVVAGNVSTGHVCGALVPARHFGCDEPHLGTIGRVALAKLEAGNDITEKENANAIMAPGVYARVLDSYRRINPQQKPSILFAPGVRESIWFAEEFTKKGIAAAHVDGEECWVGGELHPSTDKLRDQILADSESGKIKVICNRFVLREGIDAPWLAHGIFACVFGSLQSYLQSGGRLLRTYKGMEHVTIQDHGGNWWRHGSLNADREWNLNFTDRIVAGLRNEAMGEPATPKPFLCPACKGTLIFREVIQGRTGKCPYCGHVIDFTKRSRPVVQHDGRLIEHPGDPFRVRKTRLNEDTEKLWERFYWRARKSKKGMTFNEARGLFCHEQGYFPPPTLKLMPKNNIDWFFRVRDIPTERLL